MSIVENTTKRLLIIPGGGAIEGSESYERVSMPPGFSKVDDDVLARTLGLDPYSESEKNKTVCMWFDIGYLKLCENKAEVPVPSTLEGVNAKDSVAFIKRTIDGAVLRGWLADELRSTVRRALELRLTEMGVETTATRSGVGDE